MFGIESEYAVVPIANKGRHVDRDVLLRHLARLIREQGPHARGLGRCDTYFANGGRFYVDCGYHPEFCTPECTNPWDVVRYTRAGEKTLADACEHASSSTPGTREVGAYKCNVDYSGGGTTWGCHESYLHRAEPAALAAQLVPHLVSRVLFTGAGGFNPRSAGIEYTLSPRSAHLRKVISGDSTSGRGIVHTKDEPLCRGGFHRLHLLCGESLCSEVGSWLKVGTTAIVVAMVEVGLRPADGLELQMPLAALRTIAGDPTCSATVPTTDGPRVSAIAIQRRYLEAAEAHLGHGFMPPWAPEVCRSWRETLDRLAADPAALSQTLDWAIKLDLYRDRARRRGVEWSAIRSWNYVVGRLGQDMPQVDGGDQAAGLGADTIQTVLGLDRPVSADVERLGRYLKRHGLHWDGLRPFLDLRQELFEIDFKFGRLGPHGLFEALDGAGVLSHRVSGVDNIEHAMNHPPAEGRARLRGEAILRLAGSRRVWCDWQKLWDGTENRSLDLSDPFENSERWRSASNQDLLVLAAMSDATP